MSITQTTCKPQVMYILGRRESGKSHAITQLIAQHSPPTLILVMTEHNKEYHALHTPEATLCKLSESESESPSLDGFNVLAFDDIHLFNVQGRQLLHNAMQSKARAVIVSVSHPCSIPLAGRDTILQLSQYHDHHGSDWVKMLKATYAFQLAANVPGSGNTSTGTAPPLCCTAKWVVSMSQ